jgi:23S rRNA (cytidine1920-2'-O)/16S rRNA (cytidine1409-2'-O)-methyltransferase
MMDVLTFAQGQGFSLRGLMRSPLLGPKGNVEFLAWLGIGDAGDTELTILVQRILGK